MRPLTFIIFCLEGAVLSFNVAASAALVPSIAADFAVSPFLAGKIVWLYMLPYGIAALLYGPLVRALDAKKVEIVCMLVFSLANLFAGLSANIYQLFTARFMMGFFGASVIPLGLILISRQVEAQSRGRFVGVFFSSTFVASLLGLFLSSSIPWRMIFFIPAVAGGILCLFMGLYLPSFREEKANFKINYGAALKNKAVFSLFAYIFFISLMFHGVQQWLSVYFSLRFQFSQFIISILITLTSLSGIFGEVFGGWLADTAGRRRAASLGASIMVLSIFCLLCKLPVVAFGLIMVIWGLGWTINHAGLSTLLTELPSEFINEAASLNSSVRFISGGLGALLGGILLKESYLLSFNTFGYGLLILAFGARKWLTERAG